MIAPIEHSPHSVQFKPSFCKVAGQSLCLKQCGKKINVFSAGTCLNFSLLSSSLTFIEISSIKFSSNFKKRAIFLNGEYNKSTTYNINLGNMILSFLIISNPNIKTIINKIIKIIARIITNCPKNI